MLSLTRRRLLSVVGASAMIGITRNVYALLQSINKTHFVSIGGIEQWIAIRGGDCSRTAILFLHGGPGEAQSPFLSFFAPWEERYVVAQWDQRGSGKTFGKIGVATPNMTLEQLTQDTIEVAQYVINQLGIRKLILVGHSWGSMLGLCVVRARPELFHVFVGTGQIVSGRELIESWRLSAIKRARRAQDADAVMQLNSLREQDFNDDAKLGVLWKWRAPFTGSDWDLITRQREPFVGTYEKPANAEAINWYQGFFEFSQLKLWPFTRDFDARAAGMSFPIPYFVVQGRDDDRTPSEPARKFLNELHAPLKGYSEITGGHFACFTNPSGFLNALDKDIRRLGIKQ